MKNKKVNDDTIHLSTDSTQEEIEKWLEQMKKKSERINRLKKYNKKITERVKQQEFEFEIEIQEAKKILNLIYGVNVDAPFYK